MESSKRRGDLNEERARDGVGLWSKSDLDAKERRALAEVLDVNEVRPEGDGPAVEEGGQAHSRQEAHAEEEVCPSSSETVLTPARTLCPSRSIPQGRVAGGPKEIKKEKVKLTVSRPRRDGGPSARHFNWVKRIMGLFGFLVMPRKEKSNKLLEKISQKFRGDHLENFY